MNSRDTTSPARAAGAQIARVPPSGWGASALRRAGACRRRRSTSATNDQGWVPGLERIGGLQTKVPLCTEFELVAIKSGIDIFLVEDIRDHQPRAPIRIEAIG